MKSFRGKVVWITGASSGLGAALAYAFDGQEASLILSARRMTELEKVKARCRHPENIMVLPLDLEQSSSFPEKINLALQHFGRLDILINNAGISQRSLMEETEEIVYRKIMETNFFGPVALSRLVLSHFRAQKTGSFVNVSSLSGVIGLPLRTAYSASKFALEGFWSAYAAEQTDAGAGVSIMIVRPGAIRTGIAENALSGDGKLFNRKDPLIEKGIDPGIAAQMILKGIQKRRKTLFIGSAEARVLLLLNRFLPALALWAVKGVNRGL